MLGRQWPAAVWDCGCGLGPRLGLGRERVEAEAGGGLLPNILLLSARCCSLFCTQVGVGCSHGSWWKKHPSHFLVFLIKCLTPEDLRWNWWLSFPKFLASVGRDFLREGRSGGPGSPTFYSPPPPHVGVNQRPPFPSGSSFSPLDSSLPEDVPVYSCSGCYSRSICCPNQVSCLLTA